MPRGNGEWYTKESVHDNNKLHARQCCSYYSVLNVNKTNYPFSSSYEQEQTWTLTRTMSNNHKRYQSSIENIHLTMPRSSANNIASVLNTMKSASNDLPSNTNHVDYENIKINKDQLSSLALSQKYTSSSSLRSSRAPMDLSVYQEPEQKSLPMKIITNDNFNSKNQTTRILIKPMRVIHSNGEFVVRI
jgi:hypothetical protein